MQPKRCFLPALDLRPTAFAKAEDTEFASQRPGEPEPSFLRRETPAGGRGEASAEAFTARGIAQRPPPSTVQQSCSWLQIQKETRKALRNKPPGPWRSTATPKPRAHSPAATRTRGSHSLNHK